MRLKFTALVLFSATIGITNAKAEGAFKKATNETGLSEWKTGRYYLLRSDDGTNKYLTLSQDSVIVKSFDESSPDTYTKSQLDSALWEISEKQFTPAQTYQFKNKKTGYILSLNSNTPLSTKLNYGQGAINEWLFKNGNILAYFESGSTRQLALHVDGEDLKLEEGDPVAATSFKVFAPDPAFLMTSTEVLTDVNGTESGVFQLNFNGTYSGNIFANREIVATTDQTEPAYLRLQLKGQETIDGKDAYVLIDTAKNLVTGAVDEFGAQLKVDTIYTEGDYKNIDYSKFQIQIDLKTDSVNLIIKDVPNVNGDKKAMGKSAKVVFGTFNTDKILTVSDFNPVTGMPTKTEATLPLINLQKGNPVNLPGNYESGIYYLKSAKAGADYGKYIIKCNGSIKTVNESLSDNLPLGQWLIKKESNTRYSAVDRNFGSEILKNQEIYLVQGTTDTYYFGSIPVTIEYKGAVSSNKFLGTKRFTKTEIDNNGYALDWVIPGIENLYMVTSDSLLKVESGNSSGVVSLKLELVSDSVANVKNPIYSVGTGAHQLHDTLYYSTYKLKDLVSGKYIAYDEGKSILKLSSTDPAREFVFVNAPDGQKCTLIDKDKQFYVFVNTNTAYLFYYQWDENVPLHYFNLKVTSTPEYASLAESHRTITTAGKSLTMNTNTFFAEMKQVGDSIYTKAKYDKDNFSLWVEKAAASRADKNLYFISKADPAGSDSRYYLVTLRDSNDFKGSNPRLGFIQRDTIKTMANSPALFAFMESANGYILENQREIMNGTGSPYVSLDADTLVLTTTKTDFKVEATEGPVSNIEVPEGSIKVLGDNNQIIVMNASGKAITVVNTLGKTEISRKASSDHFTIPTSKGVMFVTVEGEKTFKVIVK